MEAGYQRLLVIAPGNAAVPSAAAAAGSGKVADDPGIRQDDGVCEEDIDEEEHLDEEDEQQGGSPRTPKAGADIVQFSAPIYFTKDDEGVLLIDILRLGPKVGRVSVQVTSQDDSAVAGRRFHAVNETVVFEDKEPMKTIRIGVIVNPNWSATLEFRLHLTEPVRCKLGRSLKMCRIKLINTHFFPSDKFGDEVAKGMDQISNIPGQLLFLELCKLIMTIDGVKWRVLLTFAMEQVKNLYLLWTLISTVYLVNVVFSPHLEGHTHSALLVHGDPEKTARIIGLCYFVPVLFVHGWDYVKLWLNLPGKVQLYLQSNLLQKYLNYSSESRRHVTVSDLQQLMERTSGQLAGGFVQFVGIGQTLGKLIILATYITWKSPSIAWCVYVMPSLISFWIIVRMYCVTRPERAGKYRSSVMHTVAEACNKYKLIASYFQRPQIFDMCNHKLHELAKVELSNRDFNQTTEFVFLWLGPVFIGGFIALQSPKVLHRQMELGDFLATLQIIRQVADLCQDTYEALDAVTDTFIPLRKCAVFMNRQTDLQSWFLVNRSRREATKKERQRLLAENSAKNKGMRSSEAPMFRSLADQIPLSIKSLSFKYASNLPYVLQDVSLGLPQGSFVMVVGARGTGSHTFMKLLGQELFPTTGCIFWPSHLRVCSVSYEPMMISFFSPFRNLVFGNQGTDDARPERVKEILKRLKLDRVHKMVEQELEYPGSMDDHDDNVWQDSLTFRELALMHLARALVMNAEVMVMHHPLYHYQAEEAAEVMSILREHVANRGICLDPNQVLRRRPRTLFISHEAPPEQHCDNILWEIRDRSVHELSKV